MEIQTIGIIGAGPAGRGIACLCALHVYRTILESASQEFLDDGMDSISRFLDEAVAKKSITPEHKIQALANLSTSRSIEDVCREADLLIEAAQEELEVKLEIFTLFDKFARPAAILASSSPTISIAELAEITFRTENCIGMRFREPIPNARLLELVRTIETSEDTLTKCIQVGKRLGREVVVTRA
jgi:3-hydroxybutyryl-CoA dehydrogenase